MTSVQEIETQVLAAGLYPYLTWQLKEFPVELHPYCGRGLGLWQYPRQFAQYLNFVATRYPTIKVYAEVGVAAGGTYMFTSEFLEHQCGMERSYAADIAPLGKALGEYCTSPYEGKLEEYLSVHRETRHFVRGDSVALRTELLKNNERVDLLLIDGDHSYSGVKHDFDVLQDLCRVVVFHDITSDACPGVGVFWRELRDSGKYETHEFTEGYSGVTGSFLGIGVLLL